MKTTNWFRASMLTLIAAAALTACRETEVPLQPEPPEPPPGDTSATVTRFSPVMCTVNVAQKTTRCGLNDDRASNNDLVVGGQGRYIDIQTTGDQYNVNTQTYSSTITVRNLIGQKMGTVDGVSLDPRGVRIFFADGPHLTSGAGDVALTAIDGYGNYTGGQQPYLQFNNLLDKFQLSSGRVLTFSMPQTVTSFTYTVYVATVVQFPNGWIDVQPASFPIAPHTSWKMVAVQKDALGDVVVGTNVAWTIADSTVARIQSDGTATGVRAGGVQVTATAGLRSGTAMLFVSGIERTWTGAADTNWNNKQNWADLVVPVAADSVIIPASAPVDPALTQNQAVTDVTVEEAATINIGPFDLTASGNVMVGLTPGITNTTGRVIMTGVAKTTQGRFGRIRVTGTYSLTGNLTARAPIEVAAGRLTSAAFRVTAESI